MVVNLLVVGEDWQLLRGCLTRILAVLVERRGEMAISNHQHCDGSCSLLDPLIRFRPIADLPLVASQLLTA